MKSFLRELNLEIWQVSYTLFKIMIPAIIIIKVLEELGLVDVIGHVLSPIMVLVGLPDSMGLVWATTMLVNLYAGMLIFVQQPEAAELTVAQVTVLSALMLMAHGLIVEARIAQRAGVRLWVTLLLRVLGGLIFAFLLQQLYSYSGFLQQQNTLLWKPDAIESGLMAWCISQLKGLLVIQLIIVALLFVLKILKLIGVEALLAWLLSPVLRFLNIAQSAASITIVGITLGLAFGGGLLIKEVERGAISYRDVFAAICLLNLLHSVIEDTILVMLLGADFFTVFWLRAVFSLLVIAWMTRLFKNKPEVFWRKYLVNKHVK